jgi:hypothetical protein
MFRQIILALALGAAAAFAPVKTATRATVAVSETKADLEALAPKLNPVVPFWDPLGLADATFWDADNFAIDASNEATIGFLRHAEIKHGRVAMAAFVGYCVQANGIKWPWPMTFEGLPFPEAGLSPEAQWDAIPIAAKTQIIMFVAILELWSESATTHYMKGGKPGMFPDFIGNEKMSLPHPVPLNLFDPFGFSKGASEAKKEAGLIKEINNGRLAMIGIMGFLAEAKVPGSVPFLGGIVKPYAGNVMAPFAPDVHMLPQYVQ